MADKSVMIGADGKSRCWWCGDDALYQHYHDTEWGRSVHDNRVLFEKICLEGFQAGLSWITILRKRENFRAAFDNFNCDKVAKYGDHEIERLLQDAGIIRHRGKIEATINNANRALELIAERGSLSDYVWSFAPQQTCHSERSEESQTQATGSFAKLRMTEKRITKADIPTQTPESAALSKDLRKRGWKFVGPTTCYAFMQAMGMVNDHVTGCHVLR